MYKKSDIAKLEMVLKYIQDIGTITKEYKTIYEALNDIKAEYAIMMCIVQIAENIKNIKNNAILQGIKVREIIGTRNIITHAYGSIEKEIIEKIIKENLPELKSIIKNKIENL